jgi:hypothetical protein
MERLQYKWLATCGQRKPGGYRLISRAPTSPITSQQISVLEPVVSAPTIIIILILILIILIIIHHDVGGET